MASRRPSPFRVHPHSKYPGEFATVTARQSSLASPDRSNVPLALQAHKSVIGCARRSEKCASKLLQRIPERVNSRFRKVPRNEARGTGGEGAEGDGGGEGREVFRVDRKTVVGARIVTGPSLRMQYGGLFAGRARGTVRAVGRF